jgi:hypothetical protein
MRRLLLQSRKFVDIAQDRQKRQIEGSDDVIFLETCFRGPPPLTAGFWGCCEPRPRGLCRFARHPWIVPRAHLLFCWRVACEPRPFIVSHRAKAVQVHILHMRCQLLWNKIKKSRDQDVALAAMVKEFKGFVWTAHSTIPMNTKALKCCSFCWSINPNKTSLTVVQRTDPLDTRRTTQHRKGHLCAQQPHKLPQKLHA